MHFSNSSSPLPFHALDVVSSLNRSKHVQYMIALFYLKDLHAFIDIIHKSQLHSSHPASCFIFSIFFYRGPEHAENCSYVLSVGSNDSSVPRGTNFFLCAPAKVIHKTAVCNLPFSMRPLFRTLHACWLLFWSRFHCALYMDFMKEQYAGKPSFSPLVQTKQRIRNDMGVGRFETVRIT